MFATSIHFHSSLIFLGKARNMPLEQSRVKGSILVSFSTMVEKLTVANSLAYYDTAAIAAVKSFIV